MYQFSFDVLDRCFCKVETMACETLRSCTKRLVGVAVTTLPGELHSFNPALALDKTRHSQSGPRAKLIAHPWYSISMPVMRFFLPCAYICF